MAIDAVTARTRRALLAGTLGGAVALVAGALGRPLSGQAADGDAIHVGDHVSGTGSTRFVSSGAVALEAASSNDAGVGVRGYATASSGETYGVVGRTDSTEGTGVRGYAHATSGLANGVVGRTDSTFGTGVHGFAYASSGRNYGVVGYSNSVPGRGVYGEAAAGSGSNYGVVGVNTSTDGAGVLGDGRGRGGHFIGTAAQVRLEPASGAHPASGLMGDLFLDNDGSLWLCKGTTDWKQIALIAASASSVRTAVPVVGT